MSAVALFTLLLPVGVAAVRQVALQTEEVQDVVGSQLELTAVAISNSSLGLPRRLDQATGKISPTDEEVIFLCRDDYKNEVDVWKLFDEDKDGVLNYFEATRLLSRSDDPLDSLDMMGTVALKPGMALKGTPDDPRAQVAITFTDFVYRSHSRVVNGWYGLLKEHPSPTVRDLTNFFVEAGNEEGATEEFPWDESWAKELVQTAFVGSDKLNKGESLTWDTTCSPRVFFKAHQKFQLNRFWFQSHDADGDGTLDYSEVEQILVDYKWLREVKPGGEEAHMAGWEKKLGKFGRGALKNILGLDALSGKSMHRQKIKDFMSKHGAETTEKITWRDYLMGENSEYKEDKKRDECLCKGGFFLARPDAYDNDLWRRRGA